MTQAATHKLNKAGFFADMGYSPHPGQAAVHDSTALRRVCACGVRWGKTTAACMEGLAAAMEPKERSVGWVVAPTYDLCDRVFRELVHLSMEHLNHRIIMNRESDRILKLRNMSGGISEIRGKSADNATSLLGEGLDWLIVDEASRIKATIWESHLTQRLIDKQGWAMLISTPKGKGGCYNLWRLGRSRDDEDYESWNSPSWDNPMLDREFIERERTRLPERVFEQEYGAKFVEGAGAVFRNIQACATLEGIQPPSDGERYYAGLDLAKTEDYTVLVITNRRREVVYYDRFHRLDWAIQVSRVKKATDHYNYARIWVDTTGKGEPVFEALAAAGCRVEPYTFSAQSKARLIDNLALVFEEQAIKIPTADAWPECVDELEGFQYSITPSGNTKTGAPSGAHDDCVIGLALAMWPLAIRRQGESVEALFL